MSFSVGLFWNIQLSNQRLSKSTFWSRMSLKYIKYSLALLTDLPSGYERYESRYICFTQSVGFRVHFSTPCTAFGCWTSNREAGLLPWIGSATGLVQDGRLDNEVEGAIGWWLTNSDVIGCLHVSIYGYEDTNVILVQWHTIPGRMLGQWVAGFQQAIKSTRSPGDRQP